MKVKDIYKANPVKNTNNYSDFINYIDTSSVDQGRLVDVQLLQNGDYPSRAQRKIERGDILYSSVRPNLRHYYLYNDSLEHPVASTGFVLLRQFNDDYDNKFCYYYLSTEAVVTHLSNIAELSQATFPSFSVKDIEKINLPCFSKDEQRRIASILSAYDNLIENNNKRIRLLEQMAENLYKEWFVRFRFPGHEKVEMENGLPKGWKVLKMANILDIKYGKDHSKIDEGDIPILGSGGIMRYGNRMLYSSESVLIPRKGSLNNIMYINEPFWTVDTMFYTEMKFRNIAKYIYYVLSGIDMESFNSGAALPSMTTNILNHFKIIIPTEGVLSLFDERMSKLFALKKRLQKQSELLSRQRDLLLPRLMSGKLEVKE